MPYTVGDLKRQIQALETRGLITDSTKIAVWKDRSLISSDGIHWAGEKHLYICDYTADFGENQQEILELGFVNQTNT